jgi:capsular polysaccharide export protein
VYSYGLPFYAGWGLTIDRHSTPRRTRRLSLEQLVAGALIIYPRYYDYESKSFTTAKHLIKKLIKC